MGGVVEKPKNFKATMTTLLAYCVSYLPVIIVALIAAAAGTILQIIGPDQLKELTNEVMKGLPALVNGAMSIGSIDMEAVTRIAWVLVSFYAAAFVLNYLQSLLMATKLHRRSQRR